MKFFNAYLAASVLAFVGCSDSEKVSPTTNPLLEENEELSGGDTTVFDATKDAFNRPVKNLRDDHEDAFFVGNSLVNRNWVVAPSSTEGLDGLGPVFNARSCSTCHFKDGRGTPPEKGEPMQSMLIRLSIPGVDEHGGPKGDPIYGGQLQNQAIDNVPVEGTPLISYEEITGKFADGETYSLRKPTYSIEDLGYGPLPDDIMMSPRTAPAMIGLGLLEAIPDETILDLADPDDSDDDGISGRVNMVWDVRKQGKVIGRMGWKANNSTVEQQISGAFNGDMGLTSELFTDQPCTGEQEECSEAPSGGAPEVDPEKTHRVAVYSALLAVPARRDWDNEQVLAGKKLFIDIGCAKCHITTLKTGISDELPEVSEQIIHPYTDLLLHDMGEELSDNRPDYDATGSEWRTAPLWGIGLVSVVNGHSNFLHDGRARNVTEAIVWHGGEGKASKDRFVSLPSSDREALLRFVESL